MFDSNFIHRPFGDRIAGLSIRHTLWRSGAIMLGVLLCGRSGRAADWSCSFEAAEGYISEQSVSNSVVGVLGGTVVVMRGDAAEGQQFIRYTPQLQDNALMLTLGSESPTTRERLIRFAFRLVGDPEKTRLVLSCGQTVALRPIAGAVELEVGDKPPQRFTISAPNGAWVGVAIDEHTSDQTWDLSVGATVIARGLAMQSSATLPSNLLIFADGSLDLDAIHVTVTDAAGTVVAAGLDQVGGNLTKSPGQSGSKSDPVARGDEAVSRALGYAKAGELDSAESIVAISSAESPDTSAWHLDVAARLSAVAYALHDDGHYASSIVLGAEVLRHLQLADQKFSGTENKVLPAASAFMAARINDKILNNPQEAQRQYQRVLGIDASHGGAQEALDQIASKVGKPANPKSGATKGG